MKKILNYSILTILAILMSGCLSDSLLPDDAPGNNEPRTVLLRLAQPEAVTRSGSPIPAGDPVELRTGKLYLVSSTNAIVRHYEIVATSSQANFADGGNRIYRGDLVNGVPMPSIPSNVRSIVAVGNYQGTALPVTGNITDIQERLIHNGILSQHHLYNPGVHLFGKTNYADDAFEFYRTVDGVRHYNVHVHLAPSVARFELHRLKGLGSIYSFRVEGIFIDRHYRQARIDGSIPKQINGSSNLLERNPTTDAFRANAACGYYPDANRVLFDLPNIDASPVDGGGAVAHAGQNNVWGYQLFAYYYGATSARIIVPPRIVIRLSRVMVNSVGGAPVPLGGGGTFYLTVDEFRNLTEEEDIATIRAGNVYRIQYLVFDESNLSRVPNQRPMRADVTVNLGRWNVKPGYHAGFWQPDPVDPAELTNPGQRNIPLEAAIHGSYTGTIRYLWQRSIVTNPNPGNPDHWTPHIANLHNTASVAAAFAIAADNYKEPDFPLTNFNITTHLRRVAFTTGKEYNEHLVSNPARVVVVNQPCPKPHQSLFTTTYVGAMYDFQMQRFYIIFSPDDPDAAAPIAWQWQWAIFNSDNPPSQAQARWNDIPDGAGDTFTSVTIAGNRHHHASWVLPANFIHRAEIRNAFAAADTGYNRPNVVYFRAVITDHNGYRHTQPVSNRFPVLFVPTTDKYGNFLDGFGIYRSIRYARMNSGSGVGAHTIYVMLQNLGANRYDGGLGSLYQWGRHTTTDEHHRIGWTTRIIDRQNVFDRDTNNQPTLDTTTPKGQEITSPVMARGATPVSTGNVAEVFTHQVLDTAPHVNHFIHTNPITDWGGRDPNIWGRKGIYVTQNSALTGRANAPATLEQWENPFNNPCPPGWRVPSRWEWWDLHRGTGSSVNSIPNTGSEEMGYVPTDDTNHIHWGSWQGFPNHATSEILGAVIVRNTANRDNNAGATIILPTVGVRNALAGEHKERLYGYYWTSTQQGPDGEGLRAWLLRVRPYGNVLAGRIYLSRSYGASVRCVR